jgi:hypothetical protein
VSSIVTVKTGIGIARHRVQCHPAYDVFYNSKQGLELTAGILKILNLIKGDEYNMVRLQVLEVSYSKIALHTFNFVSQVMVVRRPNSTTIVKQRTNISTKSFNK